MKLRRTPVLAMLAGIAVLLSACYGRQPSAAWSGPAVANSTVYVGTAEGHLLAIDPQTRDLRWRFPATDPNLIAVYGTPNVTDTTVYVGGWNGGAYAVDPSTGQAQGQFMAQSHVVAPIVTTGDTVLVASADHHLYALDRNNLAQKRWDYTTGSKIWAAPAVDGGSVYVASMDGSLTALDLATGQLRWKFQAQGALLAAPLAQDGVVYAGGAGSTLYAVDAATGTLKWSFQARNWIWAKPLIVQDTLYVGSLDQTLYALSLDGQERWRVAVEGWIRSDPVYANGLIVSAWASQHGQGGVFAVDPVAKQIKWDRPIPNQPIEAPVTVQGDTVYANTVNAQVYALNIADGTILWSYPEKR